MRIGQASPFPHIVTASTISQMAESGRWRIRRAFPHVCLTLASRNRTTLQLNADLWVVHAFQKKSTQGIKTPQREIDAIRDRLKRLKELLK